MNPQENKKKLNSKDVIKSVAKPIILVEGAPDFECRLEHNLIESRNETLFYKRNDGLILCNLDGYAIIPRETYEAMKTRLVELEKNEK